MNYVNLKQNKGFTLVELAIVLVIIGLIVSSILVGQDLITSAELRATVKQYDQFQAAVNTFYEKYNKMPGDALTSKYGLDGAAAIGDEDGNIEGTAPGLTMDGEVANFWAHLTTAGKELLPGDYAGHDAGTAGNNAVVGTAMPAVKSANGTGWTITSDGVKNYYVTGAGSLTVPANANYIVQNIFVPVDAYNIDSKIDDGVPNTGSIQVTGSASVLAAASSAAGVDDTVCVNTTPTPDEYQLSAETENCNMRFDMSSF